MNSISTLEALSASKGLKFVHLNIRSIVKKIDQIRTLISGASLDVFSLSETWLRKYLSTQIVHLKGYKLFRLDRATKGRNGKVKRGGGLITYVNEKLASNSELLDDLCVSNEHVEAQWVFIHRPQSRNICICNLYRPPNGNLTKAISYLENCIQTFNLSKTEVILMGDLNVNYVNKGSPSYKKFNFFAKSMGLTQHISTTTRNTDKSKSLIDLALSNSKFIQSSGTLDHFISDHQPIYVLHKKGRDNRPKAEFRGRSYRNFDKEIFRAKLLKIDWTDFYSSTDPANAWNFLQNQIVAVLDEICPIRTFHIKNYRPDWMNGDLIEQIKDRDYFYKKAKKTGDDDMWNIAKYLRNLTNANIRHAKREFILHELKQNENNAKKFWKIIQSVVPSNSTNPNNDILLKDGDVKINKSEVATFINDYFVNVGKLDPNRAEAPNQEYAATNPNITAPYILSEVSEFEVAGVIKSINTSKSSGLENINSMVVKVAFEFLKSEVTFLYNLSVNTVSFPDDWKKALVIPIPKKGNLTKVQNYRPISLLPLPGKIMEKLLHHQLSTHLDYGSFLADEQHGFRKAHSTVHAIAQLTSYINKKQDVRLPTLAVFIDFRKAFDCVQHPLLLKKLKDMNVGDLAVDWVRSYLTDRKQRVLANNVYSPSLTITQGVPQGSVLGPLFYIIYANDLSKIVKNCEIAMYADDTVLYISGYDFCTSVRKLQEDIDAISCWCNVNGIMANTDKTKVMVFGSNNSLAKIPVFEIRFGEDTLQRVTSYNYLGITLDSQLNYNLHVTKVISLVTGKLNQFRRMRKFLTTRAALMVYKGMLLPLLEYGDIFLVGASVCNRKKLQILQNKGLRCALNRDIDANVCDLHSEANLLKLHFRREQHILNYMFEYAQKTSNRRPRSKLAMNTRSSGKVLLRVKRPYTEKFRKSLSYLGPKKWNNLPINFHNIKEKAKYKSMVSDWVTKRASLNVSLVGGLENGQ